MIDTTITHYRILKKRFHREDAEIAEKDKGKI